MLKVISPKGWDVTFGMPLKSEDGLSFVRAIGTQNIAIGLIAIFAAITGMRGALAAVFAAIALIAALDFYMVNAAAGVAHALKHAIFVLVMTGISAWVVFS
ncbi:MAG: DUF4267 domain-containing protein [Arenicellales bacterium]